MKSGCPGGPLYAETLASALAVYLLHFSGTQALPAQKPAGGLGKPDLARVLTYIGDHLAEALTLTELAACTSVTSRGCLSCLPACRRMSMSCASVSRRQKLC